MCRVVNKYKEAFDVYIGRGSIWGNPFTHLTSGTKGKYLVQTREEAIRQYKGYLWGRMKRGEVTEEMLLELDGKRLGCFCKPKSCHGDVIVAAVNYVKNKSLGYKENYEL